MKRHTALAVFVKTPGHSAVKTRLAADTGIPAAEAIYRACVEAVAEVVELACQRQARLRPHWAVAEPAALHQWARPGWSVLAQPAGGLGTRLHGVQQALLAEPGYDSLIFIGADSPQIDARQLIAAVDALQGHDAALGPAEDGGFWLWASRHALPLDAWQSVPWSSTDTLAGLRRVLPQTWSLAELPSLRDLDHASDLSALRAAFAGLEEHTPAQLALGSLLGSHAG